MRGSICLTVRASKEDEITTALKLQHSEGALLIPLVIHTQSSALSHCTKEGPRAPAPCGRPPSLDQIDQDASIELTTDVADHTVHARQSRQITSLPPFDTPFDTRVVLQEQWDGRVRVHIVMSAMRLMRRGQLSQQMVVAPSFAISPPPHPPPAPPPPKKIDAPQTCLSTLQGLTTLPTLASTMAFWPPYKHRGLPRCTCRLPPILAGSSAPATIVHRWPCARASSDAGFFSQSVWSDRELFKSKENELRAKWSRQRKERQQTLHERLRQRARTPSPRAREAIRPTNLCAHAPHLQPRPPMQGASLGPSPRSRRLGGSGAGRGRKHEGGVGLDGELGRHEKRKVAASRIQAQLRGFLERKGGWKHQLSLKAPVIQRTWRAYRETSFRVRQTIKLNMQWSRASIIIQSVARMWLTRSAIRRRQWWTEYRAEKMYEIDSSLACFSAMRSKLEHDSARTLQLAWRKYLVTKSIRMHMIRIQRVWRGHNSRFRDVVCEAQKLRRTRQPHRRRSSIVARGNEPGPFLSTLPFAPSKTTKMEHFRGSRRTEPTGSRQHITIEVSTSHSSMQSLK
mgnify:CR=1 FL=1